MFVKENPDRKKKKKKNIYTEFTKLYKVATNQLWLKLEGKILKAIIKSQIKLTLHESVPIWSFFTPHFLVFPADIYLFKVNNGNGRAMYEICSKLTITTSERRQWHRQRLAWD